MDIVHGFSRNIKLRSKVIIPFLVNIGMLFLVAVPVLNTLFMAQTGVNGMMKDEYPTIALGKQLNDEINTTIQQQALLVSPPNAERRDIIMNELQGAKGIITEIYRQLDALAKDDHSMACLKILDDKRKLI